MPPAAATGTAKQTTEATRQLLEETAQLNQEFNDVLTEAEKRQFYEDVRVVTPAVSLSLTSVV